MNLMSQMAQQLFLRQAQQNNPALYNQVMQMTQGKTPQQMRQICENVAKERGVNLQQFMSSQLGLSI